MISGIFGEPTLLHLGRWYIRRLACSVAEDEGAMTALCTVLTLLVRA
jgi:hypothetical protein